MKPVCLLVSVLTVMLGSLVYSKCPENLPHTDSLVRHGDICYQFIKEEKKWAEARDFCWENDGRLVEPKSDAASKFLATTLDSMTSWKNKAVWIGLTDKEDEGKFQWSGKNKYSSERLSGYTNWADNQPGGSLLSGSEDCVRMVRDEGWMWKETRCKNFLYTYRSICQYPGAVSCYECGNDEDCNEEPYGRPKKHLKESCEFCSKGVMEENGVSKVMRGCIPSMSPIQANMTCESSSSGTGNLTVTQCFCDGDRCNGVPGLTFALALIFGALLFIKLV